jgi:alkanesulfonate monooxygenase SsuD/methylene tetrahydromethanopterin reductase-like flavin-dependent oxidoreductase (luciferase family)
MQQWQTENKAVGSLSAYFYFSYTQAMLSHILRCALLGSLQTVADKLNKFIDATEVDELIVSMPIHDIKARLKSAEMFVKLM